MIAPLCRPGAHVLEVGCGRGDVLVALAERGLTCVGIEPSARMIAICEPRPAVRILSGTANCLDFDAESFDLVFSQQVLEHLHPDDVPEHLAEAFRVLRPGGILAVETPNRRTGPQDISRGFTMTAEGLHLKEWSWRELGGAFRDAGFSQLTGVLAPPFLARRSEPLFRWTIAPWWTKLAEDALLGIVPGVAVRTMVAKVIGVDDLFLIGRKASGAAADHARQQVRASDGPGPTRQGRISKLCGPERS